LGSEVSAGRPIRFIQSDLFENISCKFDIIMSNPPYVPSEILARLAPEVRNEPRLALDGGKDGLELIKKIISSSPEYLLPDGVLFLEAGAEQMPLIKKVLEDNRFGSIVIHKDLSGIERVIQGSFKPGGKNSSIYK
jgi:release factor glutamine methyltransferase